MRTVHRTGVAAAIAALFVLPATAFAAGAQSQAEAEKMERALTYKKGTLVVRDAQIAMPRGYRYLSAVDARITLERIYGNPPDNEVLGLVVPPKSDVLSAPYVVVVTHENDGHVSDQDAAKVDYTKMLSSLQKDESKQNEERQQAGYAAAHLVGWAEQPRYDPASHKL